MFLVSGIAAAKNNDLQDDMVALERIYIAALALTSANNDGAYDAMADYEDAWGNFSGEYKYYRASHRNWISYFNHVNELVGEASDLVAADNLLDAHEILEEIRTTMAEFRGRNGFPKFIADDFTAFHSIMGEIIGVAGDDFDDNTLAILDELYIEASHAWSKVEKNPVDLPAWGIMGPKINAYDNFIIGQRTALDNLEYALSSGIEDEIKFAASPGQIKTNQAKAYVMLSAFSDYFIPPPSQP